MEPAWTESEEGRERHPDSCAHDRHRRKKEEEAEQDGSAKNAPVLVGFRAVYVFDVSQTEGAELPALGHSQRRCGNALDRLIDFVTAAGHRA